MRSAQTSEGVDGGRGAAFRSKLAQTKTMRFHQILQRFTFNHVVLFVLSCFVFPKPTPSILLCAGKLLKAVDAAKQALPCGSHLVVAISCYILVPCFKLSLGNRQPSWADGKYCFGRSTVEESVFTTSSVPYTTTMVEGWTTEMENSPRVGRPRLRRQELSTKTLAIQSAFIFFFYCLINFHGERPPQRYTLIGALFPKGIFSHIVDIVPSRRPRSLAVLTNILTRTRMVASAITGRRKRVAPARIAGRRGVRGGRGLDPIYGRYWGQPFRGRPVLQHSDW